MQPRCHHIGLRTACWRVLTILIAISVVAAHANAQNDGLHQPYIVKPFPTTTRTLVHTISTADQLGDGGIATTTLNDNPSGTDHTPERTVKRLRAYLVFHAGGDRETYTYGKVAWDASVTGTLVGIDASSADHTIESSITIQIDEQHPEAVFELPITDAQLQPENHPLHPATGIDKYESIEFRINDPNGFSRSIAGIDSYLRLSLRIDEEIVYDDLQGIPTNERLLTDVLNGSTIESNPATCSQVSVGDYRTLEVTASDITITWNLPYTISDARYNLYEVDLLRLYNTDASKSTNPQTITATVKWNTAQRFQVKGTTKQLRLSPVEGSGFYVFRVRPITTVEQGEANNPLNVGAWSDAPADGATIDLEKCDNEWSQIGYGNGVTAPERHVSCFYFEDTDADRLWTASRSSATDTQRNSQIGEARSYLDAFGRVVQSLARDRGLGVTIGSQVVYDLEGRASLQTMPVPVTNGQGAAVDLLKYQPLAVLSNSSLFTADSYDRIVGSTNTYSDPEPLDNASPIGQFYSDDNPDLSIPGAGGFQYSRTLYASDGRPRSLILPGADRRPPSSQLQDARSMRTLVGAVGPNELLPFFGSEVPNGRDLSKVVTVSPDGVTSVAYYNKSGQVILTGLLGSFSTYHDRIFYDGSDPLSNLNGKLPDDAENLDDPNRERLVPLWGQLLSSVGGTLISEDTLVSSIRFVMTSTGTRSMQFLRDAIKGAQISWNGCFSDCIPCNRSIWGRITRVDVIPPQQVWPTTGYAQLINLGAENCETGSTGISGNISTPSLAPGEYILERIVVTKGKNSSGETPEMVALNSITPAALVSEALSEVYDAAFGTGNEHLTPNEQLEIYDGNREALAPDFTVTVTIGENGPCIPVVLPERRPCDDCPFGGDPGGDLKYAELAISMYQEIVGSTPGDLNDVIFYLDDQGSKHDKLGSDATPTDPPDGDEQKARLNGMFGAMFASGCSKYEGKCKFMWSVWQSLLKARCLAIKANPTSPDLRSGETDIVEAYFDVVGRCYPATCTTASCWTDVIAEKITIDENEETDAYARIRTIKSSQEISDCIYNHTNQTTGTVDWDGVNVCLSFHLDADDRHDIESGAGISFPDDVGDADGVNNLANKTLGELHERCRKRCEDLEPEIRRQLKQVYPTASDADLWCRVQAVLEDCKQHCNVDDNSSAEDITRFKQQLFGGVTIAAYDTQANPDTCPAGYTEVTSAHNLVDALVDYLNDHYNQKRLTTTENLCINYAAVMYNFLIKYVAQWQIPACIVNAAALSGPPVNGLYTEVAADGQCAAFESVQIDRMFLRILPGIEGRFYRPVGTDSCRWCAVDFAGPRFSTQALHPWIGILNSMMDALWGFEVGTRDPDASTEHLMPEDPDPAQWYEYSQNLPDFLAAIPGNYGIDADLETALALHIGYLNNNTAYVNGSPGNWPMFSHGILGGMLLQPLPLTPMSVLYGFDQHSWRASVDESISNEPWKTFGPFGMQFGIPMFSQIGPIKPLERNFFSWRLEPSELSGDNDDEIDEISLIGNVNGQRYTRRYTSTEPGNEYRNFASNTFTSTVGLFQQDAQRRLQFHDIVRNMDVSLDDVRFWAWHTRRLLGVGSGTPISCLIGGLCSTTISCGTCVKWDTISADVIDDIDRVGPMPCDQRELERIKAEISRLFNQKIQELQKLITEQIKQQCSAKDIQALFQIQLGESIHHVTLYYYDRAGRLVRAVSPKGVDMSSGDFDDDPPHTFVSRFRTDSKGRLVVKTVPDGGDERYYYDRYGRLRFIVDAVQWGASSKRMTYFKYDELDRILETGEVTGMGDQQGLETSIEYYIDDMSWPGTGYLRNDVARYHYDDKASTSSESGWTAVSTEQPNFSQKNTRLRLSWADAIPIWTQNETDVADLANVVRTFFTYDPHGNVTSVVNDIPVNDLPDNDTQSERLIKKTDYTHDLSTGNITDVDYQKGQEDAFLHKYTYDASGRLKIVETSRNDVLWDRDVVYDYNLDGSLKRETIGEDSVQGRDYTYTLLGQIKGINHPTLDPDKDPGGDGATSGVHATVGKDAFGMSFHYHEDDFLRSYNTTPSVFNDDDDAMLGVPEPAGADPYNLYSGLLGAWTYNTQETGDANIVRDGELLGERFRYDKIGRLRADTTYSFNGTNWVSDGDGGWSTRFVYDQNSNLIHVKRWGIDGSTGTLLDNSTLTQQNVSEGSNVVESIEDTEGSSAAFPDGSDDLDANDSEVDEKGRVTEHIIGQIDGVAGYSSRDELQDLKRGTLTTSFVRNAFSEIVREDVTDATSTVESYYIIPGSVIGDQAVYHRSGTTGTPLIKEWSIMGPGRIGVSRATEPAWDGDNPWRLVGKKYYDLTDHLGSVKALVSDVLISGGTEAEILGTNDFDPYGGRRIGRNIVPNEPYRYGFQGMRLVDGLDKSSDYLTMFRTYNVRAGNWSSIDPIMNPGMSAYTGLDGLPTMLIDPYGLAGGGSTSKTDALPNTKPAMGAPTASAPTSGGAPGATSSSSLPPDQAAMLRVLSRSAGDVNRRTQDHLQLQSAQSLIEKSPVTIIPPQSRHALRSAPTGRQRPYVQQTPESRLMAENPILAWTLFGIDMITAFGGKPTGVAGRAYGSPPEVVITRAPVRTVGLSQRPIASNPIASRTLTTIPLQSGLSVTPNLPLTVPAAPEAVSPAEPQQVPFSNLSIRSDITMTGGRRGEKVPFLVGPPNSVIKGSGPKNRIFITNDQGQVVFDIDITRVKPITPGVGPGEKDLDILPEYLELINKVYTGH